MTAREKLLEQAPRWTEREAEIALRAVAHVAEQENDVAEDWGDLSALRAALNDYDASEAPEDGGREPR